MSDTIDDMKIWSIDMLTTCLHHVLYVPDFPCVALVFVYIPMYEVLRGRKQVVDIWVGFLLLFSTILIQLTHLSLVPYICISESGQQWFR